MTTKRVAFWSEDGASIIRRDAVVVALYYGERGEPVMTVDTPDGEREDVGEVERMFDWLRALTKQIKGDQATATEAMHSVSEPTSMEAGNG